MTDSLDDLAAFLMHRTGELEPSDPQRLRIFTLVGAYQEGDQPAKVEAAMRMTGLMFSEHHGYRREWRP